MSLKRWLSLHIPGRNQLLWNLLHVWVAMYARLCLHPLWCARDKRKDTGGDLTVFQSGQEANGAPCETRGRNDCMKSQESQHNLSHNYKVPNNIQVFIVALITHSPLGPADLHDHDAVAAPPQAPPRPLHQDVALSGGLGPTVLDVQVDLK